MDLKGSKTEKICRPLLRENLRLTLSTNIMQVQPKEGYNQIGAIFTETAGNEKSMPNYGLRHCMAALFPRLLKI